MKKIIFIMVLFLNIFIGNEVKGLTYNEGKIYEIYHQEAQVGVYAADKTYYSMDYNGIMVKSTAEDYTFYCVGPESYLSNSSEASLKSHYVYEGYENIIGNSRLNDTTYKKISLLSYYAYGYKSSGVDHTSKKWYGFAQVMIWRILRPDINFAFKTSRYGVTNAPLYDKEVAELNDLVTNHDKIPSFSNQEISLLKGDTITLTDTNNVIKNFNVSSTDKALLRVENNNLIITALENGFVTITLTKPTVNNNIKYYKGINVQDVIARGDVTKPSTSFKLNITSGTLNIKKVDADTNIYNNELNGSSFNLYDKENNLLKTITISKEIESLILPYGTYFLKEQTASNGYKLNETVYEIKFTEENTLTTLEIPNSKIKGDLVLEKYKGGADEDYVLESKARFEIKDLNNNVINTIATNDKGLAKITLLYGKYTISQIEGPNDYTFIKDFEVNITEERVYKYELKNVKKSILKVLKTDYSSSKPLKDTKLALYDAFDVLIYEGLTDENGLFIVKNLELGNYYLKEIKPSKYYKLSSEKIAFSVTENGKIINIDLTNEKNKGTLEFFKVAKDTNKPLENTLIRIYYLDTKELIFEGATDEKGLVSLENIEAGNYVIEEIKPSYGYLLNKEKMYFELKEEKEVIKVVMTNEKLVMPDTSLSNSHQLIAYLLGFSLLILVKRMIKEDE